MRIGLVAKLLDDRLPVTVAEAEYRGVANVVVETYWLRNLLRSFFTCSVSLSLCDIFTKGLHLDADWAGCPTTRRSTSHYCVFLRNNLVSWSSKRQPTLSRSSAEAEYRGVANVVVETYWLRNILRELHTPLSFATLVYCDNVSAVFLSSNPVQHQRTKHIEIDIHFVRDLVVAGQVHVMHVPSRYHYVTYLLKGYPRLCLRSFVPV
ncbi:ribonuclease H-like domain-containing protein [Tanacetum coccineum]